MRGTPDRQLAMLSSLSPEDLIPADHPIRRIRFVVDAVLAELDEEFEAMYAPSGRPSVPPEQLLKATVLMAMYAIRSERAFSERLNYERDDRRAHACFRPLGQCWRARDVRSHRFSPVAVHDEAKRPPSLPALDIPHPVTPRRGRSLAAPHGERQSRRG